ncbi:MAG: ABC transporter ATP-binding protein [Candidatus Bathyarchaeia archaeon]
MTQEAELDHESQAQRKEPLLRVSNLRVSFITRAGKIQALNDVSFEVKEGETFALVGETGCGKSQTALAVMRLTPEAGLIERGTIWFAGRSLTKNIAQEFKLIEKNGHVQLKRSKSMLKRVSQEMDHVRGKEITMIFQEPMTSLNPVYTVGFQISETLLKHRMEYLADRILSRNAATQEKLKEITNAVTKRNLLHKELRELLQQSDLEVLEDQIWSILSRKDVGVAQKLRTISDIAQRKIKPITLRFLVRLKKSDGKIPLEYEMMNRIPVLRKWLIGALEKEAMEVSHELLCLVNMPNAQNVLLQYPHELSGGMRQRVMIAIAVATRPKLVIADEPTSALDVTVQAQILELLRELKRTFNSAILFISHDIGVISEICDTVGVMYAGNLVEVARLDQLFSEPKHPYTQGLLASIPKYGEKREQLQTIEGTVPNLIDPPKGCRFRTRCPHEFEKCSQGPPWIQMDKEHGVLCWLYGDSERHVDQ